MQQIRKVAILGAGAMGAYFAACFYDNKDFTTVIAAKDERYEKLKRDGLIVNGKAYQIPVVHPDEVQEPADLIIVALKHHHLPQAVDTIKNLVGDHTVIISVMNGLDSEVYLGSVYGHDKLLYAISVGIDAVRAENEITYTKPGIHYFGEKDNTTVSERVKAVHVAFDRVGIAYKTPVDMMRIMWWKFMINVGMNQASAVMRAPYGVFHTSEDARALMDALMREVITLAKAEGVNLVQQDLDEWYTLLHTLSPQGKTSMLQDVEAGRKTEVEIFSAKVVELGKKHTIPIPVNETVLHIIRVLERDAGE